MTSATRSRFTWSCASASSWTRGATPEDGARGGASPVRRRPRDGGLLPQDGHDERRRACACGCGRRNSRQDVTYAARMLARQPESDGRRGAHDRDSGSARRLSSSPSSTRALLAPLPYRDADRLVVTRLSVPDYRDLRDSVRAFEATGIWASNLYMLDEEQVLGGVVSPSVFDTLGVAPVIGRTMAETDGDLPSPSSATGCGSGGSGEIRG